MNSEFLFTAYRTIRTGDFLLRPLFNSDRDDLLEIYSNYESVSYWHKGIASSLLNDMTHRLLGAERFIRIELLIHPENIASIKTAEKCGYEREGHLRMYAFNVRTGAFDDRLIYSKVFDNQEDF